MNKKEFDKILELHSKYLRGEPGGIQADLRGVYLSGVNLSGVNLYKVDLSGAYLRGADLSGVNLRGADLSGAYLYKVDLSGANLSEAYLSEANLSDANLPPYLVCPEEGSFTAWKKVRGGVVLKLRVPARAKRVNAISGRKIRVSEAKVVAAYRNGEKISEPSFWGLHTSCFLYTVGEIVKPDKFSDDIRVECTHGIHCFLTRREAEDWSNI